MALRDDLLPIFTSARTLIDDFGLRTTRVIRRLKTWSGGEIGRGVPTNTDLEIDPRPRVRKQAGSRFVVDKITPSHTGGGYTYDQLNPADVAGVDMHYVLIGPSGAEEACSLVEINDRRNFGYELVLESRDRAEPT